MKIYDPADPARYLMPARVIYVPEGVAEWAARAGIDIQQLYREQYGVLVYILKPVPVADADQ